MNRLCLAAIFTLSFAGFLSNEPTRTLQLIPLALLAALTIFRLRAHARAFWTLVDSGGLLLLFLCVLILGPSFFSEYADSFRYALVICACLLCARLYMALTSAREVLEAYFWSEIASLILFLSLGFPEIVSSAASFNRLYVFGTHPNLFAFLCAGYFCADVWKIWTGTPRVRVLAGIAALLCLVIIVLCSSRSALVAIGVGLSVMGLAMFKRAQPERRRALLKKAGVAIVVLLVIAPFLYRSESAQDFVDAADTMMAMNDPGRDLGSGFSGRFERWNSVLSKSGGWFLIGRGMRYSDSIDLVIDNSFIVILLELGIVPLTLITCRFLYLAWLVIGRYVRIGDPVFFAYGLLVVAFSVNNITERHLFAVGNPYSLVAILFFAAPNKVVQIPGTAKADSFIVAPNHSKSLHWE